MGRTDPVYTGGLGEYPKTEKCDRCGVKVPKLKMCSGCKIAWYVFPLYLGLRVHANDVTS